MMLRFPRLALAVITLGVATTFAGTPPPRRTQVDAEAEATRTECPWITEATARAVLGGTVTAKINIKDASYRVCEFSRQQGKVRRQLSVVVIMMTDIPKQFSTYATQCESKATPLRTIGDEAIMCSIQTHTNLYAEKVVGRVRDRAFNVTVASSVHDDPSMTPEMRREKVQLASEQVAGILRQDK